MDVNYDFCKKKLPKLFDNYNFTNSDLVILFRDLHIQTKEEAFELLRHIGSHLHSFELISYAFQLTGFVINTELSKSEALHFMEGDIVRLMRTLPVVESHAEVAKKMILDDLFLSESLKERLIKKPKLNSLWKKGEALL